MSSDWQTIDIHIFYFLNQLDVSVNWFYYIINEFFIEPAYIAIHSFMKGAWKSDRIDIHVLAMTFCIVDHTCQVYGSTQ